MGSGMSSSIVDESMWASLPSWDMPAFLGAYTLHDSHLVSVEILPWIGALVSIQWDLHWNRVVPSDHESLVIRFSTPYSVRWTQGAWHQSTLSGAKSEPISTSGREAMLESGEFDPRAYQGKRSDIEAPMFDGSLTRTVFELMNWSALTIVHSERVQLACLDKNGNNWQVAQANKAT